MTKAKLRDHQVKDGLPQVQMPPKIISISPIELKAQSKIRIFQVNVKIIYLLKNSKEELPKEITDYIVFEYCPDVFNPRWRICGRVKESNHYYLN